MRVRIPRYMRINEHMNVLLFYEFFKITVQILNN